eukprot:CAMPEP_0206530468 /NCGR_PEP_ID=MMETSP0325_2-20121206/3195_1 /ASSEMBLY_ACC=CAM_ASM_000347 /TAXON_ID=2866 /ORGANISM="Crypthecodinium cohnii, Strain Seligo" /LENGTH=507 /DNA_ID=CAMNT_0054026541 /DNA_START=55 /DNA_END=1578 /DNA_ORIENTATION=+
MLKFFASSYTDVLSFPGYTSIKSTDASTPSPLEHTGRWSERKSVFRPSVSSELVGAVPNQVGGSPATLPLWVPRHLYSSGFDARQDVARLFYPRILWVWSEETVEYLRELWFDFFYSGKMCKMRRKISRLEWGWWGLFSEMRDAMDVMWSAFLTKTPLEVEDQDRPCGEVKDKRFQGNPWMSCFFEPLTSCNSSDFPESESRNLDVWKISRFGYLWDALMQHGLRPTQPQLQQDCQVNKTDQAFGKCVELQMVHAQLDAKMDSAAQEDWDRYDCKSKGADLQFILAQSRMSIMRALLFRLIFKPVPFILERVDEVRTERAHLPSPMLIVHIRRTDKVADGSALFKQEATSKIKQTLIIIKRLIRAAERLSKQEFGSLFVISDNPSIAIDPEAGEVLSSAGSRSPVVLMSRAGVDKIDTKTLEKGGHEKLSVLDRKNMNAALLADILWAVERASYIVGNGRSGVSQIITQLIGARLNMDPNFLGLFEDDLTTLECLKETEEIAWLVAP